MSEVVVTTLTGVLRALSLVYDIFAYIPYFFLYRPGNKLHASQRLKAKSVTGDPAGPWRSVESIDKLTTTLFPECATVDDLFIRAVELYTNSRCLGTRELLREEEEQQPNGRIFKKVVLGEYLWESFEGVFTRISNFGSGLLATGQRPRSKVVIFAETRAEWMIAAQACFKYNFPLVTLYATLGQEAIIHGVNETQVTHVITSSDLISKFDGVLDKMPTVTHLVAMTNGGRKPTLKNRGDVTVLTMEEVELEGAKPDNIRTPVTKPKREDIAVIMYTSGSTGLPKGVVISHGNLMCGMSGQCERIPQLGKHQDDIYIGYLPLAHVLELTAEISCLSHGVPIGYSSPQTLTDQSTKIKKGTQGDITVLRPTMLAAVPVIMDRLYKGVWDKVNSGGVVGKAVFQFSYNYKLRQIENGYDTPLLNKVIFKKVAQALGGNIRVMLCGGAPLSGATQRFMAVCFSAPVLQGYGLTETCGAGTVAEAADLSLGRVGQPITCSEFRLRDWPEGGYLSSDHPYPRGEILIGGGNIAQGYNMLYCFTVYFRSRGEILIGGGNIAQGGYLSSDHPYPRGEILIGGGNIAQGYYMLEQQTKEDFITIEGVRYFCSGDVGQFEQDGVLKVIDRKKDLVKLQMGEYVSLGKVETAIKMCPLVDQVCVCADSTQNFTVCLMVPNEKQLRELMKKAGNGDIPDDFEALCKHRTTVQAVTKAVTEHAIKSKLERFEIPQKFSLCLEPWTPDTGLVTDAFKLKRKNMDKHFSKEIAAMYSKS